MKNSFCQKLPTLEELQARGKATVGRQLTADEQAIADAKPRIWKSGQAGEALCKRQFMSLTGTKLHKIRDDTRTALDATGEAYWYSVTDDVDFKGDIMLRMNGTVASYPLRVEAKAITLRVGSSKRRMGALGLNRLTRVQRGYLQDNMNNGGLSLIHLSWWLDRKCQQAHILSLNMWNGMEMELAEIAGYDKRFKGKSLRYHEDLDIIEDCYVYKLANRWHLTSGHWLEQHIVREANEPQQLPF